MHCARINPGQVINLSQGKHTIHTHHSHTHTYGKFRVSKIGLPA
uniref:Uncharacterized protein n=1 Tax=Anguilla anguilla TaxID=7936 RepID=A0A0E9SFP8_ANGAN